MLPDRSHYRLEFIGGGLAEKALVINNIRMRRVQFTQAVMCLLLLHLTSVNTAFAEDCIKQVFNVYCLGGGSDALPDHLEAQDEVIDGLRLYKGTLSGKSIEVAVAIDSGRVVSVKRFDPPGSWLHFNERKSRLVRRYGRHEDLSTLPAYATSRSSRMNAINAGRGYAKLLWSQPGWTLALVWDHRDYVTFEYALASDQTPLFDDDL